MGLATRLGSLAAALAACTPPPNEVSPNPTIDAPPFADALPFDAALLSCSAVPGKPDLALERVIGGLRLPVLLTAPAGDRRLFVIEQTFGRVRLIKDGLLEAVPFLDIDYDMGPGDEMGMLGLAFHPGLSRERAACSSPTRSRTLRWCSRSFT